MSRKPPPLFGRLLAKLAAALVITLGIYLRRALLGAALIVENRVRRLLISVGSVFDQRLLCLLETLRLAAATLDNGAHRGVEVLVSSDAAYLRGFRGGRLYLFVL